MRTAVTDAPARPGVPAGSEAEVRRTLRGIADTLLRTADHGRTDRLWPSDYTVFATNPLSLAYGACGPALLLRSTTPTAALPADVTSWLLRQPLSTDTYPPGLYVGLAGIAWAFHSLGLEDRAESVMEMAYKSPLLFEEPGVLLGAAGWGSAALRFHATTGSQLHLDHAVRAGDSILESAEHEGATSYWRRRQDDLVHYGYGYGASGIALFLLHLYTRTGDARYRTCALRALEFDLNHVRESGVGMQWPRFQDDTIVYPYWIHGSAGVGSVLIRFHHLLGIERYGVLARRVADDAFIRYSYTPGLFEGLAGIGELMLDMYRFTSEEHYRSKAFMIADTIQWFRIETEDGTAFPGRALSRITHDYATGSAGIGLFLSRLLRPGDRAFVDMDI